MKQFFRKFAAAVFIFAALFAPVHPAAAWDEVCMRLPLWKTGFAAHFHVVHAFNGEQPGLPIAVWRIVQSPDDHEWGEYVIPSIQRNIINGGDLFNSDKLAYGQIQSPDIRVNQTRCVNITGLRPNEPFFVLLNVHGKSGRYYLYCDIHPSAAAVNPWYNQTDRPYRKINFEARGVVGNPKCEFTHESN